MVWSNKEILEEIKNKEWVAIFFENGSDNKINDSFTKETYIDLIYDLCDKICELKNELMRYL